jgi:seryl-tRNA synthetase
MAKRRKGNHEEVMLIPFLDILCSLIGILILIIVVLCVVNTQQSKGRTSEEVATARKFDELSRQRKSLELASISLNSKLAELEGQQTDSIEKQTRLTELKKRLNLTGGEATANKVEAAKIQKQIENLLLQIDVLVRQMPPIQQQIEELKKELVNRNKKPDDKPVPVVIQPSGTGQGGQKKLFFIETSNGTITLRKGLVDKQNIGVGGLATDPTYNDFLSKVKSTPNAMLIFLIRPDGDASYNLAAGFAQSKFEILTGKLPIPGSGEVDLMMFYKN